MAIWAMGPPQANNPKRRKRQKREKALLRRFGNLILYAHTLRSGSYHRQAVESICYGYIACHQRIARVGRRFIIGRQSSRQRSGDQEDLFIAHQ